MLWHNVLARNVLIQLESNVVIVADTDTDSRYKVI